MQESPVDGFPELSDKTVEVPIESVRIAASPRLCGVDEDHVRTLAEVYEKLPPILVHHDSMAIIDGMHRISAAQLNGRRTIKVRFFHGNEKDAFRLAVKMNVRHGLPLSKRDRQAAAIRLLGSHPHQSDRSIAATTGLSAKTVADIRRRVAGPQAQGTRVGRDGRTRPLNTAEGRRIAGEMIKANPDASLREVAGQAGISVGTVRDVRALVLAGADPVPSRQLPDESRQMQRPIKLAAARLAPVGEHLPRQAPQPADIGSLLDGLRRDPSLRYTEAGRSMLMWLNSGIPHMAGRPDVVHLMPPHCGIIIAQIARECAQVWTDLADEMDRLSECA